jgi:hypothetical protein
MRAKVAKALRRSVYGDLASNSTKYFIDGQQIHTDRYRKTYQLRKRVRLQRQQQGLTRKGVNRHEKTGLPSY